LRHPEVVVTGLNDRGERGEIDKDVFRTDATIDRASHSVRTADGRLHWSAVMVELRKEPEAKAPPPAKDDSKRFIEFAKAARRVHRSLCGDDTITGLTSQERWLVTLDFLDASDKGLVDEWQEAVNKDELWRHQCDETGAWLEARGFVAGADGMLDRAAFEKALAAAFVVPVEGRLPTIAPEPAAPKSDALPMPKSAPAVLGDREIITLAKPVIDRIAADGRQLRRTDFGPLLRELTGDWLPGKVADRLWAELARAEWRKSGKRREGTLVEDWRSYLKPGAKPS
jgi:hypothetical protein